MTDKKISDLISASVVNDADVFPMVQSGDTKKATIAQMKAAVAPSLATESAAGIIEIASQAEAESQTNDDKAMTALKVQQFLDVGTVIDGATGGNQGDGTINAKGLFINGEAVGGGGGRVLIATSTPTGVSDVTFSSIPQTYRAILLEWKGVSSTATQSLTFQFVFDATNANRIIFNRTSAGTVTEVTTGQLQETAIATAAQTTAGYLLFEDYTALSSNGISHPFKGAIRAGATATGASTRIRYNGEMDMTGLTDTGLTEITFNTGNNIDAGTINVWGIK